jgi:hypothetical protein
MWKYVSGTYMIPKNTKEGDVVMIYIYIYIYIYGKQTMQRWLLESIILLSIS